MFSQGLSVFQNASHFAVNVLGASQQALATKFAKSSEEKFADVEWTPGLGNAPLLADSVANFQCRAANRYYGGDHVIFLGAVEAYSYNRQRTAVVCAWRLRPICRTRQMLQASEAMRKAHPGACVNQPVVASGCRSQREASACTASGPDQTSTFRPIPVADFAGSHQRDAVVADDIVEQRLQIFDPMRDAGNVRDELRSP